MSASRFKPIQTVAFLTIICGALCLLAALYIRTPSPVAVDVRPEQPVATFMLQDKYVFRQDDTRWSGETIGQTEDSLSAYGCTIASVAMAASNLTQSEITPMEMEHRLTQTDGFTSRGLLIWDKVSEATDGKVSARYYDTPNHRDINSCMEDGNYPVVKIKIYDSIIHWVTIVGTTENQYLIRDPLVGKSSDSPIELSERSSDIYGVRCIRLNN